MGVSDLSKKVGEYKMGIMNGIKEGADLTHPKPTAGWLMGAVIAVALLVIVWNVVQYVMNKGKSATSGAVKTVEQTAETAFGTGV